MKKEIIFDEDYKGKRFTYGLNNRPFGFGCQPNEFIIGSNRKSLLFNFGTIDYPFELSDDQLYSYELTKIETEIE